MPPTAFSSGMKRVRRGCGPRTGAAQGDHVLGRRRRGGTERGVVVDDEGCCGAASELGRSPLGSRGAQIRTGGTCDRVRPSLTFDLLRRARGAFCRRRRRRTVRCSTIRRCLVPRRRRRLPDSAAGVASLSKPTAPRASRRDWRGSRGHQRNVRAPRRWNWNCPLRPYAHILTSPHPAPSPRQQPVRRRGRLQFALWTKAAAGLKNRQASSASPRGWRRTLRRRRPKEIRAGRSGSSGKGALQSKAPQHPRIEAHPQPRA